MANVITSIRSGKVSRFNSIVETALYHKTAVRIVEERRVIAESLLFEAKVKKPIIDRSTPVPVAPSKAEYQVYFNTLSKSAVESQLKAAQERAKKFTPSTDKATRLDNKNEIAAAQDVAKKKQQQRSDTIKGAVKGVVGALTGGNPLAAKAVDFATSAFSKGKK